MIIYDLCCDRQHRFEGWFRSAGDFDSQLKQHLISCPKCESSAIRRVPSAVAIASVKESADRLTPSAEQKTPTTSMPLPSEAIELYRQLAGLMIAASEDVGSDFAQEARRIHYKETPERLIRGQATNEECEALTDEGIEVIRLPAIKKEDLS